MKLKDHTVNMDGVDGSILYALSIVEPIMKKYGDFVVTSAKDGQHSKKSLHYVGLAFDFRTWALADHHVRMTVFDTIKTALGRDYDVIDEGDHGHIECSNQWLARNGDPRKGVA